MRGKVCWNWSRWSVDGITPAYAGKRYIFKGLLCGFKDHPRLCGEKCAEPSIVVTIQGSPPPMRGKVVRAIPDILRKRITPAYAGKSANVTLAGSSGWDHPRLCGEKSDRSATCFFKSGSPPPMRGKVNFFKFFRRLAGITPAYAGKSSVADRTFTPQRDHPRLCGEKNKCAGWTFSDVGSPPPMRGKVHFHSDMVSRYRITPAYAGKSGSLGHPAKSGEDHPRLCGEKGDPFRLSQAVSGSPPPMRGKGWR